MSSLKIASKQGPALEINRFNCQPMSFIKVLSEQISNAIYKEHTGLFMAFGIWGYGNEGKYSFFMNWSKTFDILLKCSLQTLHNK